MTRTLTLAALLTATLAACTGDEAPDACPLDRVAAWHVSYETLSGDCGDLPAEVAEVGPAEPGTCSVSVERTALLQGLGSVRWTLDLTGTGPREAEGAYTLERDLTSGSCSGEYLVRATLAD